MIDAPNQELDRPLVPGVSDDMVWLAARLDEAVEHWTKKTYDALRRQESPNPTVITLDPLAANPGTNKGTIYNTTAKMRCYALIFSGGTGLEEFALRVGSANAWPFFIPASPAPFTIPMPLVFDAGVDIQIIAITTAGATNWRCKVVAYTEIEMGND